MSKELLEEIKTWLNRGFDLTEEDIEWLIQQAERAQEYDRELISLEDNKHYVSEMLAKNKRYREALEEIYELAEYDEYDNTLEQIVSEVEKALKEDNEPLRAEVSE